MTAINCNFVKVLKDNPYHDGQGQFTSKDKAQVGCGHKHPDSSLEGTAFILSHMDPAELGDGEGSREKPIACGDDIERAAKLISAGKHVTLNQPDEVSSLTDKIKQEADEAKVKGEKPPVWNLADISVKGTNLFAQDNLGIPRVEMPQFDGTVVPGSKAAALLPLNAGLNAEVDLSSQFIQYMKDHGVKDSDQRVLASHLRGTQDQLDGVKVASIAAAMDAGKVKESPIFVTRDNYIIDGHHRWAATVVRDARGNQVGHLTMAVHKLDTDIGTALAMGVDFQKEWGLARQGVGSGPTTVHKLDFAAYTKEQFKGGGGPVKLCERDWLTLLKGDPYRDALGRFAEANNATRKGPAEILQTTEDAHLTDTQIMAKVLDKKEREEYQAAADKSYRLFKTGHTSKQANIIPGTHRYTKAEKKIHRAILDRIFGNSEEQKKFQPAPGQAPSITFLAGRGGSGKSFLSEAKSPGARYTVYDPKKAVVIDADEIKQLLPHYDPQNAAVFHDESKDVVVKALRYGKSHRLNVVYDCTMKSGADNWVNSFKSKGYKIKAYYLHRPMDLAAEGAVARWKEPTTIQTLEGGTKTFPRGRLVPLPVVRQNTTNGHNFDRIARKADEWGVFDNSHTGKGINITRVAAGGTALKFEGILRKFDPYHDPKDGRFSSGGGIKDVSGWNKVGAQAGSNPGGIYADESGVKHYVKYPQVNPEQAQAEVLSDSIYRTLGIPAKQSFVVKDKNGALGIASKLLDNTQPLTPEQTKASPDVRKGFVADAYLGNWDVFGMTYDNIVPDKGHDYRIDNGGTTFFRAQGKPKDFPADKVDELDSLVAPGKKGQVVYGDLSEGGARAQAEDLVATLSDDKLHSLIGAAGLKGDRAQAYFTALQGRRNVIAQRYNLTPATPAPTGTPKVEDALDKPNPDMEKLNGLMKNLQPSTIKVVDDTEHPPSTLSVSEQLTQPNMQKALHSQLAAGAVTHFTPYIQPSLVDGGWQYNGTNASGMLFVNVKTGKSASTQTFSDMNDTVTKLLPGIKPVPAPVFGGEGVDKGVFKEPPPTQTPWDAGFVSEVQAPAPVSKPEEIAKVVKPLTPKQLAAKAKSNAKMVAKVSADYKAKYQDLYIRKIDLQSPTGCDGKNQSLNVKAANAAALKLDSYDKKLLGYGMSPEDLGKLKDELKAGVDAHIKGENDKLHAMLDEWALAKVKPTKLFSAASTELQALQTKISAFQSAHPGVMPIAENQQYMQMAQAKVGIKKQQALQSIAQHYASDPSGDWAGKAKELKTQAVTLGATEQEVAAAKVKKPPVNPPKTKEEALAAVQVAGINFYKQKAKVQDQYFPPKEKEGLLGTAHEAYQDAKNQYAALGGNLEDFIGKSAELKTKGTAEYQTEQAKNEMVKDAFAQEVAKVSGELAQSTFEKGADHPDTVAAQAKMDAIQQKNLKEGILESYIYNQQQTYGAKHYNDIMKEAQDAGHLAIANAAYDAEYKKTMLGPDNEETLKAANILNDTIKLHSKYLNADKVKDILDGAEKQVATAKIMQEKMANLGAEAAKVVTNYDVEAPSFQFPYSASDEHDAARQAAAASFQKIQKEEIARLTPSERSTLSGYTNSDFTDINREIGKAGTAAMQGKATHLDSATKEQMEKMDNAFAKVPLGQNVMLRRNMPQKYFFAQFGMTPTQAKGMTEEEAQKLVGKVYKETAYSSTSMNPNSGVSLSTTAGASGAMRLNIRAGRDIPGIRVQGTISSHNEQEVILGRGTTYVIKKMTKNPVHEGYGATNYKWQADVDAIGCFPDKLG